MYNKVNKILRHGFDADIAEHILDSFKEIQENYILKKWKPSELDAGHFVESVRRAIEKELFGNYTSFSQNISNFDNKILLSYENAKGDDSYRILIPRILKSVYNIRSRRGVGHVGAISPNEMDATYILYATKWVLAELVRSKSNLSPADTKQIVDNIIVRQVSLIWKNKSDLKRILNPRISAAEQILIFLLDENVLSVTELLNMTEYRNRTNFLKILRKLHTKRWIDFSSDQCELTPTGSIEAEEILKKYS